MLLVRHGQSEWNAAGRWQGRADPELTELGRRQAAHAAARLGRVDVVVTSPLQRSLDTARILAERLGVGPVVLDDDDLAEHDAGEWQGLTRSQIERAWPGYLAADRRPPGFETQPELLARARAALDRIELGHRGAEVLVVTHSGPIGALERHAGRSWEPLPNFGGLRVTHHGDRLEVGGRLLLLDDDDLTVPS